MVLWLCLILNLLKPFSFDLYWFLFLPFPLWDGFLYCDLDLLFGHVELLLVDLVGVDQVDQKELGLGSHPGVGLVELYLVDPKI